MCEKEVILLIKKFKVVSHVLARKWGIPDEWQEIHSEMCCAFARKNGNFKNKPFSYIIKVCKNEAINNYFRGKSICSKPRNGIRIISYHELPEHIPDNGKFETRTHTKILVDKLLELLTIREKQIAEMIMEGYTEQEMAQHFAISQQRVNSLKRRIKEKAQRLFRGL